MTDGTCLVDGVCEVTLETSDRSAPEAFYTSVLGLKVLSRERDRTWLACGSRRGHGLWTPGEKEFGDEGGRHVHFALSVPPGVLDDAAFACVSSVSGFKGQSSIPAATGRSTARTRPATSSSYGTSSSEITAPNGVDALATSGG